MSTIASHSLLIILETVEDWFQWTTKSKMAYGESNGRDF